jgi:hypothetical protein
MLRFTGLIVGIFGIATFAFGEGWQVETVDAAGLTGFYTSLALDSNDYPHISYTNETDFDLKYARWDGSNWQIDTVDDVTYDGGTNTSIALNSSDYPFIVYSDATTNQLKYAKWDGSSWQIELIEVVGDWCSGPSIVIDGNDNPHIACYGSELPGLTYIYWDGSSWQTEGIEEGVGTWISLALDNDDCPHIAYVDWDYSELRYANRIGGSWKTERVDETLYNGSYCSIAADNNAYPHISYISQFGDYDLKYARWDGSSWQIEVYDTSTLFTSIALDGEDCPHISFFANTPNKLKYARWYDDTWYIETVDTVHHNGQWNCIALDSSGNPCISYFSSTNGSSDCDLKYARYIPSDIEDGDTPTTPTGFALHPAVPNPSGGMASIGFALPRACEIELTLYDIKGRKVATLAEGTHQPGEYSATASGLSSGVYIYELTADEFKESKKMVVK